MVPALMLNSDWRQRFTAYLVDNGLRLTRQREVIAEAFFQADGHPDIDQLHAKVRETDRRIGQATVYRTLKLLVDSGLANRSRFGGETTRYEAHEDHHDHLICQRCGKIIEFRVDMIERLQDWVAQMHGFEVLDHRLEIYGQCTRDDCPELVEGSLDDSQGRR